MCHICNLQFYLLPEDAKSKTTYVPYFTHQNFYWYITKFKNIHTVLQIYFFQKTSNILLQVVMH